MDELRTLRSLARAMGVHTRYTDGLGRHVLVSPETLLRVCAALGAPVATVADAADALRRAGCSGPSRGPLLCWATASRSWSRLPAAAHAHSPKRTSRPCGPRCG